MVTLKTPQAYRRDQLERYHDHLLADQARGKVSVAVHGCVGRHVGSSVTEVRIRAIRGHRPDHLPWVQVLDGELDLVVLLSILPKISFHEKGQVDNVGIVGHRGCLSIPLQDFVLLASNETLVGALRDDNDAVTLDLGSLNDRLVHSLCAVNLELDFGD